MWVYLKEFKLSYKPRIKRSLAMYRFLFVDVPNILLPYYTKYYCLFFEKMKDVQNVFLFPCFWDNLSKKMFWDCTFDLSPVRLLSTFFFMIQYDQYSQIPEKILLSNLETSVFLVKKILSIERNSFSWNTFFLNTLIPKHICRSDFSVPIIYIFKLGNGFCSMIFFKYIRYTVKGVFRVP